MQAFVVFWECISSNFLLSDVVIGGLDIVPVPEYIPWPGDSNFVAALIATYDWDVLKLNSSSVSNISNIVELCVMGMPCKLSVLGTDNSILRRKSDGSISCARTHGCFQITIHLVNLDGNYIAADRPILNVDGSELNIFDSILKSFISKSDGGAIQALSGSSITLENVTIINSVSENGGGAISAVGASLHLVNCKFINCSSKEDGGAISAANFSCSRSAGISSSVFIFSSLFEGCESEQGAGGAISSSSGKCTIISSSFLNCRAATAGGAISAVDGVFDSGLSLVGSTLASNSVDGLGGGALYLQWENATLAGNNFSTNRAQNGGGGAILWNGYSPTMVCGQGSYALAGYNFECKYCSGGKFQSGTGFSSAASCLPCSPGSYSSPGSSFCTLCDSGTFSTVIAAMSLSSCERCSAGKFQTGLGMPLEKNCTECFAGTYASASGASSCSQCAPGKISTFVGSTLASNCNSICPPGTYAFFGSSTCVFCQEGKFSTGESVLQGRAGWSVA